MRFDLRCGGVLDTLVSFLLQTPGEVPIRSTVGWATRSLTAISVLATMQDTANSLQGVAWCNSGKGRVVDRYQGCLKATYVRT
jgi:hypothetical protein